MNALLALDGAQGVLGTLAGVRRPGIVHRLDRDTSGLLIVARNDAAQASLQAQLRARRVRKTIQALVGGVVAAQVGRIEKPIGRDPRQRLRMAVVPDGKPAVTGYRIRERLGSGRCWRSTWSRAAPTRSACTSRRSAMPWRAIPSTRAASSDADHQVSARMFLHAWKLEFLSPGSGKLVRLEAPLPPELGLDPRGAAAALARERR